MRRARCFGWLGVALAACAAAVPASAQTFNRDVSDRRVVKEATVAASARDAWRAFTDPAVITQYFAPRAHVELRIGGAYELEFRPDNPAGQRGSEGCIILSYLPGEMLSFSWNAPPQFARARGLHTWVVVEFRAVGPSETRVRLTHYGFGRDGEWDDVHAYFVRAWGSVVGALVEHFEARRAPA
jgi:uncharacterized protein YndB with AHSA1/START domain